ncbi:general transcription factor IIF subunit 1 [Caerostris extrusa]|uniref:Transcription initiation factor IIF subunit alpha n=1 Tax=Caerostris extrusa TaxID=172846 RepID=A0AAV4TJ81_CAEEX|nr:general transcription factor IIF subunit 1 [Caerostris extrusa]
MASNQNSAASSAANANNPPPVTEYIVKMPKNKSKCFNVMRFTHSQKVDVTKWSQVKMERENNLKEFKADEDTPKYGAGSEFGREQREESRRKKYGIVSKKYNAEDQPWLLKLNGKNGKNTKVFGKRYKALSAEEAEEEFGRRDKVLNYFSIMVKKRLQNENAEEEEVEGEKPASKNSKKSAKDFKISDMDDWAKDSSDSEGGEDEEEEDSSVKKPAKKGKDKKKKEKVEEEGREESDEGDFDDREVDYITGSSSSEEELPDEKANRELKGVEDEEALRKLDASEEEEEEEEENKEEEENPEQEKPPETQKTKKKKEGKGGDSSGDSTSETSDSDLDETKVHAFFLQKQAKKNGSDNSAASSRANTPTRLNADAKDGKGFKRKLGDIPSTSSKKTKAEAHTGNTTFVNSLDGITEEAIRRYLSRKPMTASDLLYKFKSKKNKLSKEQLVNKIADVLKKMNIMALLRCCPRFRSPFSIAPPIFSHRPARPITRAHLSPPPAPTSARGFSRFSA